MMQARIMTVLGMLVVLCAGVSFSYATGSGTLDHGSNWYPSGTNLTIKALPETYSKLDRWEGDTAGIVVSGETINCTVDGSKTLTAVFVDQVTATNAIPHRWIADVNPDWTNDFEAAVTNDWDNDGFTTAEEFLAGTCPTNQNSFLHIASAQIVGNQLQLDWEHAQVYSGIPPLAIQKRTSLTDGNWENVGQRSPTNGINTWAGSIDPQAFYRLAVTNAP